MHRAFQSFLALSLFAGPAFARDSSRIDGCLPPEPTIWDNVLLVPLIAAVLLIVALVIAALWQIVRISKLEETIDKHRSDVLWWGRCFYDRFELSSHDVARWSTILDVASYGKALIPGAFLAWLAEKARTEDVHRLFHAAHKLGVRGKMPETPDEWDSLGAADLGEEFFRLQLTEITRAMMAKDRVPADFLPPRFGFTPPHRD